MAGLLRGAPAVAGAVTGLRADVTGRADAVDRMRADVRALGALDDSADMAKRRLIALAPSILVGGSEAEAIADLTGRVSGLAAGHQALLRRTESVPDSGGVGRLARVTLRVEIESDLPGALATLAALDGDRVVLSLRSVRLAAPDPGSPDAAPEVLTTVATVSGWYLRGKGR
jgi:hypothetical protein